MTEHRDLADALEAKDAKIAELRKALVTARNAFKGYEQSHNWKAGEADCEIERNNRQMKADRNRELAAVCSQALKAERN
tara:strand:- start:1420 stop:1656 length:237 start_codon:yes stop_codon:yes gene_type:complete